MDYLTDAVIEGFAGVFYSIGIESAFHAVFGDGGDEGMDKGPDFVKAFFFAFSFFGYIQEDTEICTGTLESFDKTGLETVVSDGRTLVGVKGVNVGV